MNQYQKRKCLKGGQHHNRDIEALCLQQSCRNDRLLCFYCIHKKHENHQIIYLLEGLDSPIEKLNINSKLSDKQHHQKYLQNKIKKINHGWKNLYRLFESYIHKIQTNLEPQIAVIQQSFNHDSAKKFAQIITDAATSQQTIDKYVQKIKLIIKYDLSDIDKVKVSTAVAYEELKQIYKSANEQIQSIMSKIVEQTNIFSALDFNFSSFAKRERGKLGIDVSNQISISILKDKTTIDSFQNRFQGKFISKKVENRWQQKRNCYESLMQQKSKKNNQKNCLVKQEHDSQKQQNKNKKNNQQQQNQDSFNKNHTFNQQQNSSKSSQKDKKIDYQNHKYQKNQLNNEASQNIFQQREKSQKSMLFTFKQNQYSLNSINRQADYMKSEKLYQQKIIQKQPKIEDQIQKINNIEFIQYQKNQQDIQQFQQSESQSEIIRYRNFQYSESENSISPPTIDLKQIYLSFSTQLQIEHYLDKIPSSSYLSVHSLQISCDTLPLAINLSIINKIIQFSFLKKLVICQSYGLKTDSLQKIITNLPKLEHLVLQQNYSINQSMATLIKKNLPQLKKFHYTSDPLQNLFFKEQNSQFLSEVDGSTKLNAIEVLTSIPTLQTIVFQNVHKVSEIKKVIQKMKKISQISIIFHQKEYKANYVIQTLSQLSSAKSIVHLEIKQCYFQEQSLIKVLKNCDTLKSFVLNKCRDVTNNVIEVLKKHKNTLKQLDFMEQDEITGVQLQHFQELQILSLKACWQIQEDLFGSNIIKLKKLKCLNLNFNRYWVTQKIFDYISKLQNLQSLSIDNNKINFNCLFKIKDLSNLSALSCGNTELQSLEIINFFECTKSQIKKISLKRQLYQEKSSKNEISNQPFQGMLLSQISRFAPFLSHLNIKGMKNVNKNHFDNLSNLKCLSTDINQLNQETINQLKNRKVSLYIGYSHYNYQSEEHLNQVLSHALKPKQNQMIKLEK